MGFFPLIAILAANASRNLAAIKPRWRPSMPSDLSSRNCGRNKYGEEYRHQIVESAVDRCYWGRPHRVFDICPVDDVFSLLGCVHRNDAYRLLAAYHCWEYRKIPKDIRRRIPELVREALQP